MSAVLSDCVVPRATARRDIAVVLFGTGKVGGAFLQLLRTPAGASLRLVGAANSRHQQTQASALAERRLRERLDAGGEARDDAALLRALYASNVADKVVIDATASTELAARHPEWLSHGCHVVTANKALAGGDLNGWHALQAACAQGARYGNSATVGAGLPAVATVGRLHACGDRVTRIEGVFSGSFSYLFNHYDGRQPFSALLREACALGYTEPDPRADLSGEDVARKLLILARTAGRSLERAQIEVENLVPESLRDVSPAEFLERLGELDRAIAARHAAAAARDNVLRHLARFDADGHARVGLAEVPREHPAAHLQGADNLFAINTTRYAQRPLVIQGAGAGPEVTAQALLGDTLALA
ncbi:MAG: homoserine dehydrogenase [Xanthomonadales bacterium]|nr:homoserine dehydrogenase [Xanthomonadales bacterium]ODU94366.1 MAG: homoserine dehydrogenase [Rhodanobacter sp. SCN 66-43]OJY86973.1 MAG: homoserine dehydrogenase [Xanthomonadales bacterium 66-474]